MDKDLDKKIDFDQVSPLQFVYEQVSVVANIEKQVADGKGGYKKQKTTRKILKQCSGKFQPNTVTAILGPSGSGKTTMLNLLSGRLLSKNLILRGRIKINGKPVQSMIEYKSVIGYVMQQDLMLPTFTPRETFAFITNMRLPNKTKQQRAALVESMIQSLGLKKCANTYVGNSLIRGLSGGEKKRTSVGVELLINPSLIFLDEPTTGLDSTTALNLIRFLNRLAQAGRTVVTTIHQPSSQIFLQFNKILLMLDGNVVYHNDASKSMQYFANLGMPVPLHSNPMDHYMKLINKQGITLRYIHQGKHVPEEEIIKQFNQRVDMLVFKYKEQEKMPTIAYTNQVTKEGHEASWIRQMVLIFQRSSINQLRNPLGIRSKIFQMIFFAIVTIILYERQSSTMDQYIQNTMGILFFINMNITFSSIFGNINIFSQERPVFIRERLSNTYRTTSYYIGRSLSYIPLQLFLPFLMIVICYFAVPLDHSGYSFFLMVAGGWLAGWMASAYGLFLSTAFADAQVALSLVPILIIPLMLVGGFFAPLQNVPKFYYIFEYISVFKYLFQAFAYAQFHNDQNGFTVNLRGTDYTYKKNILGEGEYLYFQQPYWLSMLLMGLIGLAIRFLSLLALYLISNPKKIKLLPPQTPITQSKIIQKQQSSKPLVNSQQFADNSAMMNSRDTLAPQM